MGPVLMSNFRKGGRMGGLRSDDHLPNTVAILAGNCEGFVDAFDLPRVRKQRRKPLYMRLE